MCTIFTPVGAVMWSGNRSYSRHHDGCAQFFISFFFFSRSMLSLRLLYLLTPRS